jgi:cardiolipin synthase A/B
MPRTLRRAQLLLVLLCCAGCGSSAASADLALDAPDGASHACQPTDPRATPVEITVLPDEGEKVFVDLIARAQTSIRVMIYLMGQGGIFTGLKQQAAQGKDVRVILDVGQISVNQRYYNELKSAGAKVLWSDARFPYMHAKVIIGDDREALISTANFSFSASIKTDRNFVARTVDPQDIGDLTALFEADWVRGGTDLTCTRLLVSPANSRARILALLSSASRSLIIESMQLADTDVRNAVAARKKAGVDVRVLLAAASWVDTNADAATFLKAQGIPARWMDKPPVHTKDFVVDGKTAYVGSVNLSYTSMAKNREVGIVFSDDAAVQRVVSTFEKDWATATAF